MLHKEKIREYLTLNNLLKCISVLFLLIALYYLIAPRPLDINRYYDILNQSDKKTDHVESIEKISYDIEQLNRCKITRVGESSENCYKEFFEIYTKKNGPKKGLQYLHELIQKDPTIIPGCHYIAHGVGAGALSYFGGSVSKAYTFDVASIFSNVGSCANGYYHGVSIGMTYDAKNDDDVYNILYGFCDKRINNEDLGKEACNHGIGHAITQYYEFNLDKSVAMCHRLFTGPTKEGFFGCMTGVRMEYGMYLDLTGLWTEKGANGIKALCKDYAQGTPEREACVVEGSGVVRYGEDYIGAVKACQTLDSDTDRKSCTKLTVIHAIRLGRSEQVLELCNLSKTIKEEVECTAFFANYLSISVDINRKASYLQTTSEVCHTLNIFLYPKCIAIANNYKMATFRSHIDRGLMLTAADLKAIKYYYTAVIRGCANCDAKLIDESYSLTNRM